MQEQSDLKLYVILSISMMLWGGSWTAGKMLAVTANPSVIVFWRFFCTAIAFIPLLLYRKEDLRIKRETFLRLVLAAALMVGYNQCFFRGLVTGLAGAGGVIVTSLNPLITFILVIIITRKFLKPLEMVGLAVGIAGGIILLEVWQISYQHLLATGNLFFLIASCCWASLTLVSQKTQEKVGFLVYSFYVFLFSAIIDLPFALGAGIFNPNVMNVGFWLEVAYLSVAATAFATTVYFRASSALGSHSASSFIFLVPISAVFFSWLILGEVPKISTIFGGVLTIAAVYLINSAKGKKRQMQTGAAGAVKIQ
ncbi:MAG: DMT family transporter [Spirochaetia bacterium]